MAKFKMVCEKYVTDFRGREISPGNIVAVSRSGDGSRKLEAYIVTKVSKKSVSFAGKKWFYRKNKKTGKTEYGYEVKPTASYSTHTSSNEMQQHLVIIDNPLYAINNPQIEKILEIADVLKDQGVLPDDYKLGQTLLEYQEESQT